MSRAIDVLHLGRDRVICAFEIDGLIIDPGPTSCLDTLIDRLGPVEPRALLLTHIHLDHAGATGALCRRYPRLKVYVHERGAPHLVDPSKLLASAARLYGDDMDELWGEMVPVPEDRITVLRGGETVEGFEAWLDSLHTIASWNPQRLGLTHFGQVTDVEEQLHRIRTALLDSADSARLDGEEAFIAALERRLSEATDPATVETYEQAAPPDQLYAGLERYWRKKAETR